MTWSSSYTAKGKASSSRAGCSVRLLSAKTGTDHRACLTSVSTGMSAGLRTGASIRILSRRLKSHAASRHLPDVKNRFRRRWSHINRALAFSVDDLSFPCVKFLDRVSVRKLP